MSWQDYVDNQLVGAGLVAVVIIGLDGEVRAQNNIANFDHLVESWRRPKLASLFEDPSSALSRGIVADGVRYAVLNLWKEAGGIVLAKTNQAIIIGVHDERLQYGMATNIVERLADYIKENSL